MAALWRLLFPNPNESSQRYARATTSNFPVEGFAILGPMLPDLSDRLELALVVRQSAA
jgi:hypothetical protein